METKSNIKIWINLQICFTCWIILKKFVNFWIHITRRQIFHAWYMSNYESPCCCNWHVVICISTRESVKKRTNPFLLHTYKKCIPYPISWYLSWLVAFPVSFLVCRSALCIWVSRTMINVQFSWFFLKDFWFLDFLA